MHRFVRFFIVLLVIALVAPAGLVGESDAAAKKKGKVVTKTFANPDFISISPAAAGAASIYPAEIRVRGFKKGKVRDVNLTLDRFTHLNPDDVDIMLVAPGGRNAIVLADAGGSFFANQIDLTLDDDAAEHPPGDGLIASGAYAPVNYAGADPFTGAPTPSGNVALSTFNGIKANGVWRLYIFDDTDDNGGSIADEWTLTITAKVKGKKKGK